MQSFALPVASCNNSFVLQLTPATAFRQATNKKRVFIVHISSSSPLWSSEAMPQRRTKLQLKQQQQQQQRQNVINFHEQTPCAYAFNLFRPNNTYYIHIENAKERASATGNYLTTYELFSFWATFYFPTNVVV